MYVTCHQPLLALALLFDVLALDFVHDILALALTLSTLIPTPTPNADAHTVGTCQVCD
jgi:hypothetical protein